MIINRLVFPIKANYEFVQGGVTTYKLNANDINKDFIYVISPFSLDTAITVTFENELQDREKVSAYLRVSDEPIANLVSEKSSYFGLVKDWNVWQTNIPSKALNFIAHNRAGEISLSFNIKEIITPSIPSGLEYKGKIEEVSEISGDGVYVVDTIYLEYNGIEFGLRDLLVIAGGNVERVGSIKQLKNTPTLKYSVDPSVYKGDFEDDIEFNLIDNLLTIVGEAKGKVNDVYEFVENLEEGLDNKVENFTYSKGVIDIKDDGILSQANNYTDNKIQEVGGNSYEPDLETIILNDEEELKVSNELKIDGGYL